MRISTFMCVVLLSVNFTAVAYSLSDDERRAQRLVHQIESKGDSPEYVKGLSYSRFERRDKCHIYLEAYHNGAFQGGYLADICKNKAVGTN